MKRLIVIAGLLVTPLGAQASNATYGNLTVTRVNSVYDGDTFRVDIDGLHPLIGQNIPVRLAHVDTPEIKGKCQKEKFLAIKARDFVRSLLDQAKTVELVDVQRPKYFRILAAVRIDGRDLAAQLLALNLAMPYSGGRKQSWCR